MKQVRRLLNQIKDSCELTIKYNQKDIDYAWKHSDNDGRYYDETSEEVARLEGERDEAYIISEMIKKHFEVENETS
jgi:hypothetical protein